MDEIWGHVPDEVRPFPAVSYQLTALGGAASPFLHHVLNIALHAANGLVVLAIALRVARLSLPAATLAAAIFVLLPVHGESVAWITGRVDSMPALFYMAGVLGLRAMAGRRVAVARLVRAVAGDAVRRRCSPSRRRSRWSRRWRRGTCSTIGWPAALWPRIRAYLPFALMTAAYLALRLRAVRPGRAREHARTPTGRATSAGCSSITSRNVVAGRVSRRRRGLGGGDRVRGGRPAAAAADCRPSPPARRRAAAVLRADLVDDRRRADRGRRLRIAAPRLSRRGRLGSRARHRRRISPGCGPARIGRQRLVERGRAGGVCVLRRRACTAWSASGTGWRRCRARPCSTSAARCWRRRRARW